jgi:polyhydroxybutyrate depolymerase
LVHEPGADAPAEGWPLVLLLHGFGQSAAGMQRYCEMDETADEEGFLAVYPNGLDRSWNDGRFDGGADDIAFIDQLIDHLEEDRDVDLARVYVAGISNGGFMTHRVACELGDRVAAAVPVAAGLTEDLVDGCEPAAPVPVMMIWGTEDTLVPYDGGGIGFGGGRGGVLSAHESLETWATWNGCTEIEQPTESDEASDDDTWVETEARSACLDGTTAALATVHGGGHTWPSARTTRLLGKTTEELGNGDIWGFLAGFERGR